ncbi:MAG: cupin domain-containing protein [Deltaproteobacteria bacterium]|nr:cupin domain-containing protein [Deltaproteobacteria bacterium]
MPANERINPLLAALEKTTYVQWLRREGIPVHEGYGIEDVRELKLAPWPRTAGKGAFIQLYGMQGLTGMYIAEIPPGGALNAERHMYEEVVCILSGHGATEVWQEGGRKQIFEWGPFSLFAPPLNSWHRLVNGGREPIKFLAATNAPMVMDVFHSEEFMFNCPFKFSDRYEGEQGFFAVGNKRYEKGMQHIWETNFIPDVRSAALDLRDVKGSGVMITQFELAGNELIGHLAQWPAGRYHKAHYHGPGAILLGLQSSGYVLLWDGELGIRPYESGKADEVVEVRWREGSIYCPPGGWFHQHFNTGPEPARHLALRFGSRLHPVGFKIAAQRREDGVYIDVKKGGTLIHYEDEDPEVRRRYEKALKETGVACQMP